MRIKTIHVQNFKKIRNVKLEDADRGLILIGGKNGAGKSSFLDAVTCLLTGAEAIPANPIRDGEKEGFVEVETDGFTIRRTFTRKEDGTFGGTLSIKSADGMRAASPQAWLDKKLGSLSCDPVAFLALPAEKQAARLREIVGIDTTALDTRYDAVYATRAELRKKGKEEVVVLGKLPHHDDAPAAPVTPEYVQPTLIEPTILEPVQASVADCMAEIAAAEATERTAESAERLVVNGRREADAAAATVGAITAKIERLHRELQAAEAERTVAVQAVDAQQGVVMRLMEASEAARAVVIPSAPLKERIAAIEAENKAAREEAATANATERKRVADLNTEAQRAARVANQIARQEADTANEKRRANLAHAAKTQEVQGLRDADTAKTAELDAIKAEKAALLAGATFPVDGLSFGDKGGVTFNGQPLDQASGAEKIRVSMAIALAGAKEIKLVLIRDASLLDEDSLALVAEIAEAAGAQAILERVGTRDPGAVIIVDGGTV
jgi:energy-coupling factor transporter ATP-binding protein EcfA2